VSNKPCHLPELTVRIHIEQRPAVEATQIRGKNVETGEIAVVRITPEGVGSGGKPWQGVYNPSFDVTPAELISEFPFHYHGLRTS
jgi:methylthioribose-1-phosphate isomerase